MTHNKRTTDILRPMAPDRWVWMEDIPKKVTRKPLAVVRVSQSRVTFPPGAFSLMRQPGMVTAAFEGHDLYLVPARGWTVCKAGKSYYVQSRRLQEYLLEGEYSFQGLPHLSAMHALKIPNALAMHSKSMILTSAKYQHLIT